MKIAIVIGHNSSAQGAWMSYPGNQSEFVFNSEVARNLADYLRTAAATVEIFQRYKHPKGTAAEIYACYDRVNHWNPDFILELHFNSSDNPAAGYASMWHHYRSATGQRMAAHIQRQFVDFGDGGTRAILPGKNGFPAANASRAPYVLGEPFFGSNPDHVEMVLELGAKQIAYRYAKGIVNGLNAEMKLASAGRRVSVS